MAPRALASNTIAAFASNEDVFALLVSDVLNGDKIDRDTADAVNFVLLRHFGLFTTLQERKKSRRSGTILKSAWMLRTYEFKVCCLSRSLLSRRRRSRTISEKALHSAKTSTAPEGMMDKAIPATVVE